MNLLFFLLFNLINIISNNNIRKLQDSNDDSLLFNNLFSKFKEEWFNTMSDFIS